MLYHLSFDVLNKIKEFKPRVPLNRMKNEDINIKRICCSKSILGALSAIPDNGYILKSKYYPLIKVYEIDDTSIKDSFLDTYSILDKVPDAINTKECWITKKVSPINSFIIKITDIIKEGNIIKDINYDIVNEDDIDDYFLIDINISLKSNSLDLLEENDIDINELSYEIEDILNDNLCELVSDCNIQSNINENTLEFSLDGNFAGEFRRGFIFQNFTLKQIIKENILRDILNKYNLLLNFL